MRHVKAVTALAVAGALALSACGGGSGGLTAGLSVVLPEAAQ
jgi:hypothetical protein